MLVDFLFYFSNVLQSMILPSLKKPQSPRFSCGPTNKPDGWSLGKINNNFIGRYHRSTDVRKFIEQQIDRVKKILRIPHSYKIFLTPGSCTGAMEAVIWSLLGKREITSLIYDFWGIEWLNDLKKLNYACDVRISLDGSMPSLNNISPNNDVLFVWSGTTNGTSIGNLDFLNPYQKGLVVSDITSAVFIYDLPWKKIDVGVFSWQKALGSESQHGMVVMSPKALDRLEEKKNIPKIFDFLKNDFVINTPSLLTISDLKLCLDIFEFNGGLENSFKVCKENKLFLDNWIKNNDYVSYFVKQKKFQAISPVYMIFKRKIEIGQIFNFLKKYKIAYDIENYRKAKPGIRVWTGPTIKKNDLIALTNWLDWSFNKFEVK